MNAVIRAAADLQALCEAQQWRFCFIGGVAVQRWGEPRETVDVDATPFVFPPDVALRTCSAEDLIVLKAFASRPKDWVDVDGMLIRQAGRLDWNYVRRQLTPLAELKEAREILTTLDAKRREFDLA